MMPSLAVTVPDPLPRVGPRVLLRRLSTADLSAFQTYRHDEQLGRYQSWKPQSEQEALAFITKMGNAPLFSLGKWVQLGIACREINSLIGDVGIRISDSGEKAEVGFTLSTQSHGVGLATEAVKETIGLLFEHTSVAHVVGITDARNDPAIGVLERVGMRKVETLKAIFRGEPCLEHVYVLSRHDAG